MNIPISILHLSDLHRSKDSHTSNSALLASLTNDIERFEDEEPSILKPNVIVVSGDIVRGSVNHINPDKEIKEQYDEALTFLNNLVNNLLDGDKERIVLVPGNHDIDRHLSKQSMQAIDEKYFSNTELRMGMLKEATNTCSDIKWCWNTLSYYKVEDKESYQKRFKAFADFYYTFYDKKRNYLLNPEKQYDIFDMPNLGLSIVGFNSCYNTDHLNSAGAIHPDCIAEANLELKKLNGRGRLIVATWHHNTKGIPYSNNYMDSRFLKNMIDANIKLGFHGHQHKTEIIHEENNVYEQKKIIVFSSGTLCEEPSGLPVGHNRQYNIVTIIKDEGDESKLNIVLHSREKTASSSFENPVWGKGNIDSTVKSHIEMHIGHEIKSLSTDQKLLEIEKLIGDKQYEVAIKKLNKLDKNEPFVRKFLLKCYMSHDDDNFDLILTDFDNPMNVEEAIYVLSAAITLKDKPKMQELLGIEIISMSDDRSIKQLKEKAGALLR